MTKERIKAGIIQIIFELVQNNGIDGEVIEFLDLVDDVGIDSIMFITIIVKLEEKFKITFPDDVILMNNFRRIDNIVDIVKQLTQT